MSTDSLIGRQLATYHIERLLGRGGMASVYFGQDIKLKRPVAIKVIDARYQKRLAYTERFIQEAQAVARWRHENIIQVYYADEEDGLSYFAMEYIDGPNLADVLELYAAQGELAPQADVLRIGRGIARALDYAHQRGVIHRDVKPSNVFIERGGRVVLGDFGLALDVQQGSRGEIFGTAHYIAPEQARRSNEVVPQSDLYSLGVILYEMLTGAVPFDDPSPTSLALLHLTEPPPPPRQINPDLNEAVEAILLKALSKSPLDRYPSGAALMDALESALESGEAAETDLTELPPLPVGVQSPAPKPRRPLSRVSLFEYSHLASPTIPAMVAGAGIEARPPSNGNGKSSRPRWAARPWLWAAVLAGGILVLTILVLSFARPAGRSQFSPTLPARTNEVPTPVVTRLSIVHLSATPSENLKPTQGMAILSSATVTKSATPTETPPASPTVKYPGGKRFTLLYNDSSFYILQETGGATLIADIVFERLGEGGATLNRFEGEHWAEYYTVLRPNVCMRLEILYRSPYLEPEVCKGRYFSTRTPVWNSEWIFWTGQPGSQYFRVLWKGEEVGRCEIAAGKCQFFLP